jgi:hypothetical protein
MAELISNGGRGSGFSSMYLKKSIHTRKTFSSLGTAYIM